MARNFMSMMEAVESGSTILAGTTPPQASPRQLDLQFDALIIVIAYLVSVFVILAVLHRFYIYIYHFTPPNQREYEELMAARGFVQQGAIIEFDDNTQVQFRPLLVVPPYPSGEGTSGAGGGRSERHEIVATEEDTQFPSEVLARLEQDLRATSFQDRERLATALNADLPSGRSFLFPIRSHSSRMTLPLECGRNLDRLNRATQSARFTQINISPAPSSSAAAAALGPNGQPQLLTHSRSRSFSVQTLGPSGFDLTSNRAYQSARFSQGVVGMSTASTSNAAPGAE